MPIVHQNDGIDPEGADGGIDCVDDISFLGCTIHSFTTEEGSLHKAHPLRGP